VPTSRPPLQHDAGCAECVEFAGRKPWVRATDQMAISQVVSGSIPRHQFLGMESAFGGLHCTRSAIRSTLHHHGRLAGLPAISRLSDHAHGILPFRSLNNTARILTSQQTSQCSPPIECSCPPAVSMWMKGDCHLAIHGWSPVLRASCAPRGSRSIERQGERGRHRVHCRVFFF